MLDHEGNGIGFRVRSKKEFLLAQLGHGAFGKTLGAAQTAASFVKVSCGRVVSHAHSSPAGV